MNTMKNNENTMKYQSTDLLTHTEQTNDMTNTKTNDLTGWKCSRDEESNDKFRTMNSHCAKVLSAILKILSSDHMDVDFLSRFGLQVVNLLRIFIVFIMYKWTESILSVYIITLLSANYVCFVSLTNSKIWSQSIS